MNKFIELLERKIDGCDALGGLEREKSVYQSVLKDYKKQLTLTDVVGSYKNKPYAELCELRKEKIEDLKILSQVMKDVCAGVGRYTGAGGSYKP